MATQSIRNANGSYTTYDPNSYDPSQSSPISVADASNPQTPLDVQTPQPTAPYNIAGLNADLAATYAPTAPEQQATDLSTQLQNLNNQLVGKSAEQAQAETAQGLPDLTKTNTDLAGQLKGLQNEALAIPLQMQQDATGRGITAAGLAPIQNAALRQNAIKALSISSLLSANQGQIATAQSFADKAVAQKFDPIQEQIAAKTANLNLILNSPNFTNAEKARAQKQKDLQDQIALETKNQRDDFQTIISWAAAASANGASAYQAQQIANAPDLQTALSLYAPFTRDPNAAAKAVADLAATRAQTQLTLTNVAKINNDIRLANKAAADQLVPTPQNAPYINAFSNATAGLGANNLAAANKVFANILQSGDLNQARTYIVRTALANAPAQEQNNALGRTNAISAMQDITSLLQQAADKGATTNLLTGTLTNVANKLGTSGNTDLNYISSRILQALITYRKGMTGVAFGPQEAEDYKKIFPDITNVSDLNTAKIGALTDSLNNQNRSTLGFLIGNQNYDALFPNQNTANLPSNQSATTNANADFTARAKAAGYSDAEIQAYLKSH